MKFCHECGKKLPVAAGMKGCPFCLTPLSSLSSKPPRPVEDEPEPSSFRPFTPRGEDDDDYEDVDHIDRSRVRKLRASAGRLDVEINGVKPVQETMGGAIAGGASMGVTSDEPRQSPNYTHEQATQEFQKEAGAIVKDTSSRVARGS